MIARLRSLFTRLFCVVVAAAIGFAGLPAAAGTTGSISGFVTDAQSGRPIAGASVKVASPSQIAGTVTDARGHYVFVSLAPDTYAIEVAHAGYDTSTTTGISVFADQEQTLALQLQSSIKTIARVQSRSSLDLVKSGTATDVYSVNPAVTQAAAPLGGGGSLNSAYSALAAMPGVYIPNGQMGVNQTAYIRGGYYDQIGFEYDGVPVNRSFDNYPAHTASTLGQQELQIYTGGGPASSNATGLAGFINQVVKTGTHPGMASISANVGAPTFYHDLSFETGGATPDRMFSYYLGLSGSNQDFRYLTNSNGAGEANAFPVTWPGNITTNLPFWPAVYPTCQTSGPDLYDNPAYDNNVMWDDPGCFSELPPQFGKVRNIAAREVVANLHFGIPHKHDGGRDDIQLLYTNSAQFRQYYNSANDAGPLYQQLIDQGYAYQPQWPDFYTYPDGTQFLAPATTPVIGYMFPGSPTQRCTNLTGASDNPLPIPNACPNGTLAQMPYDTVDGRWDQASIVKLQYQKNMGSNAYLRFFGYTFYSNTNRSGPIQEGITGPYGSVNLGVSNFDYEVDAHTSGLQLQFADQINNTNLLSANVNYVTSKTLRYYNFNNDNTGSQHVSNLTNGTQCFAAYDGALANGVDTVTAGQAAPCNDPITQGTFEWPTTTSDEESPQEQSCGAGGGDPIPAAACANGAAWRLTFTGNQADVNQVTPKFISASIGDEWRPNEKLDINASIRFDRDEFDLTPVASAAKNFWYTAAQNEFCYDTTTYQPVIVPEPPQYLKDVEPYVSFDCTQGGKYPNYAHPDGKDGHVLLTDQFDPTFTQTYFSPRFGATYTLNPDTVLRMSAGRFAQEPQNYEVEYNSLEPNLAAELVGFIPFGFFTPRHDAGAQFSNNFDFSYERHFKGTDMSVKVTPYYRYATQQLYEGVSIPTLFGVSPSLNSGIEKTLGFELEFTKGDFTKNGLSGIVSYTYTQSKEKWNNYDGVPINPVDPYNQDIQNFNGLTKEGGGSACYQLGNDGNSYPDPSCNPQTDPPGVSLRDVIANPYYNMSQQPLLDKFGWYDTGLDYPYISPNTLSVVLNYRHDKFAITPAFTLAEGATYGTPADFQGLDPRTCRINQGDDGIASAPNPLTADYTSCKAAAVGSQGSSPGYLFVPNPYTSSFDTFGQFRQPWQFNMGLQLSYDFTPKVSGRMMVANLINQCFGGSSTPWTKQYAPSSTICGYSGNKYYISNFYNGSSPNDIVANGVPLNAYFAQPFVPGASDVNSGNYVLPLSLYFQLQVRL